MAMLAIDRGRLGGVAAEAAAFPSSDRLFREGSVFFVGGELPVYETLATMFDSHCMAATSLFFLTFGPQGGYDGGVEMARQIRKNFHVRLMAGVGPSVGAADIGRIYAAGVDNLVVNLNGGEPVHGSLPDPLRAALGVFPRWGVAAAISIGSVGADAACALIDRLLAEGVAPLVTWQPSAPLQSMEGATAVLERLIFAWERGGGALSPYLPLLTALAPLADARPAGPVRGLIDRFRNQRQLAESALRRHLRVLPAEDSLDSAGL